MSGRAVTALLALAALSALTATSAAAAPPTPGAAPAAAALATLRDNFPAFAARDADDGAPQPVAGSTVERYLDEDIARLRSRDGRRRLLVSTRPLLARDSGGKLAPVDLGLVDAGLDRRPANAPFEARIGEDPRSGFTLGPTPATAISVVPLDIRAGSAAAPLEVAGGLMWPSTHPDADTLVNMTVDGVETFEQLRSETAPDRFDYRIELRSGQRTELAGGGLRVLDAAGGVVVEALPPSAIDSAGQPVRARLTLDGDRISVFVDHREADVAYPVLLDPPWSSRYHWNDDPGTGNAGWGIEQTAGGWYDVWASSQPEWAGLFVRPVGGRVYAPGTEAKIILQAPGTTRIASIAWRHFTASNNSHRQTTRLALYGGPQTYVNDYYDTRRPTSDADVMQPAAGTPPAMATSAQLWMFTPPCGSSERNCPRAVPADGLTIAKVGAVDITLTDDDAPTALATGPLRDLADRWSADSGPFALTIGGSDPGSGIASYSLSALHGGVDHGLAQPIAAGCDDRHLDSSWGSNVCPGTRTQAVTVPSLPDGDVALTATTSDLAGNGGATSWTVHFDRVAPTVAVDGPLRALEGGWSRGLGGAAVRLRGDDDRSGLRELRLVGTTAVGQTVVDERTVLCDGDLSFAVSCPTHRVESATIPLDELPGGALTFTLSAVDRLGHEATPVSWTVRVDRARPVARASGPVVEAPDPARPTSSAAPIPVTIDAKDVSGGSGVRKIDLYAEDENGRRVIASRDVCPAPAGGACPRSASETFEIDPRELPDGVTDFFATTTDLAGNRSEPTDDFDSFQDRTPPAAPTGVVVRARDTQTLEVSWDRVADNANGSGVSHYEYQVIVDGQPSPWVSVQAPRVAIPSLPASTTVDVVVRALDYAANPSRYGTGRGRTADPLRDPDAVDDDVTVGALPGGGAVAAGSGTRTPLTEAFRPRIYFDDKEKWRPRSMESFFGESSYGAAHKLCADVSLRPDPCQRVAAPNGLLAINHRDAYLDIHGTEPNGEDYHRPSRFPCAFSPPADMDCGNDSGSAIYYNLSASRRFWYVDYWWFFRFNDSQRGPDGLQCKLPTDRTCFDHEGDWESVTIATDLDQPARVQYLSYSAHGTWFRYLRGVTKWVDDRPVPRPMVFVARGTHANYPQRCEKNCRRSTGDGAEGIPFGTETEYTGSRAWARNDHDACRGNCLKPLPERDTRPVAPALLNGAGWNVWQGRWGKHETRAQHWRLSQGPRSPGMQPHYNEPWSSTETPRRLFAASEADRELDALADCDGWAGTAAAGVLCDGPALRETAAARALDQQGAVSLTVATADGGEREEDVAASTRGLAQLVGRPLRAGEQLVASGPSGAGSALAVRIAEPGEVAGYVFRDLGLEQGGTARVTAPATAGETPLLRRPDGRLVAGRRMPSAAQAAASPFGGVRSPRIGRIRAIRSRGGALRAWQVRLRATTSRTIVSLRTGPDGRTLARRLAIARAGRLATVTLPARAGARYVVAVATVTGTRQRSEASARRLPRGAGVHR